MKVPSRESMLVGRKHGAIRFGTTLVEDIVDPGRRDRSSAEPRFPAPLTCFDEVRRRLARHVPRYDKSELCFADFAAGVDDAVRRARSRCDVVGTEHTRNPSTGVWALVLQVI